MKYTLLFLLVLVGACAENDELFYAQTGELAAADSPDGSEAALGCPRPCILTAKPEGFDAINDKRDSMEPSLREGAFAKTATEIRQTPASDGAYQFYSGAHGRGAIYYQYLHPQAYAIYGAILDEWERRGFEGSMLGYPTSDEHDHAGTRRQRFSTDTLLEPDEYDHCRIQSTYYLTWHPETGAVTLDEEKLYYVSYYNDASTEPQHVTYSYWGWVGQSVTEHVWCGYVPPWGPYPSRSEAQYADDVIRERI